MPSSPPLPAPPAPRWWAAYAALCLLAWALYAMAGSEWQRGEWRFWDGAYEATWNLLPPMAVGLLALPWVRRLQVVPRSARVLAVQHAGAALVFVGLWLLLDFVASWLLFGADHARATFEQRVLWRAVWGVFIYTGLMFGFGGALHAQRAQAAALTAARAEAALVRAELAAISGKLNPHFLFNTLNSLLMLTRSNPGRAEDALLTFSRLMRYVLDTTRGAASRVQLRDELDFVRDYLALETLRLGPRLTVDWQLDDAVLDDTVPPLTLQPLVENAVQHGLAPLLQGGVLRVQAQRLGDALQLCVADNGAGCVWPPLPGQPARAHDGVGLSALQRRFELDYQGRARLTVRSAPGAGFEVHIHIPQNLD